MDKYQIDIDSYIGDGAYSKFYVKRKLKENKDKEVSVRLNSPGGSLDHGLDIMSQFHEHGNVTVYLFGFNASASTIASLGAKKVVMDPNGFYLVHKVLNWVSEWGYMNADQMADVIEKLTQNKEENDKIDLVLANIYREKTGKPIEEILDVLKKGGWLTAQEALEYGFVDELMDKGSKLNYTPAMADKFNSFDLPLPNIAFTEAIDQQKEKKSFLDFFFSNKKNQEKEMKREESLTHINTLLNVEAVELEDNKFSMSLEQLQALNTGFEEATKKTKNFETEISELKNQVEALKKSAGAKTEPVDTADGKQKPQNTYEMCKEMLNEAKIDL